MLNISEQFALLEPTRLDTVCVVLFLKELLLGSLVLHFLFLVGFLIEDSKTLGGKREMFALKTSVSSAELVERQGGNLLEQVIFLEGCLTAVSVLD